MFKNIFRTFVSRIIAAILTFGVVFISSRSLGPENYGTIGLVMVAIGIALLFSALIGGSSLVYFTSRSNPAAIFTISSLWGLLMAICIPGIMALLNLYPREYFIYVFLISMLANISQNLMFIILGKERIIQQNIINLLQVFAHFTVVSFIFHILKKPSVDHYLFSVLISHSIATVVGFIFCRKDIFPFTFYGLSDIIPEIIKYGFWVQMSAFVQIFNYRLSYYLVDWFLGRQMLGIYTLAVQLAESFWILPRSVAIVQFAHISNMKDVKQSVALSYKLMQLVMIVIALCSIPVFFVPETWLIFIFGIGYTGIKSVLILLIPAIIIFSGTIILSHYFSGIGKVYYNTITGSIGFIFTVISCLILIPQFKLSGAAFATNITYISMFIISLLIFIKINHTNIQQLSAEGISFSKLWKQIRKTLI
jgi:O-antigen/teichoic acid export membrane protein